MPDPRRTRCQICRRHCDECGPISWAGRCAACAEARFIANNRDLRAHTGDFALAHRRAIVASFGGVLLDDLREQA
jgi:hypothetical protein